MYTEDMERIEGKINQIIAVDLFCGAGGVTRGLLDAGIDVRLGVDFDDSFRRTYEHNNKPAVFHRADVRSLSGVDLGRLLPIDFSSFFLLAACAPCQPFSKHNKNHRFDRRKSLILEVGRILEELERKPDFLFLENVPRVQKIDNGKKLKEFYKILDKLGYMYQSEVVDSKEYGVPQRRRRFVMIGVKKNLCDGGVSLPQKTHGKKLQPYRTVRDAIKHFPSIKAGQSHETIPNHESAGLEEINLKRLSFTPLDGGSRDSWPKELILKCHLNHKGHKDVYGRMKWDFPGPTLTCKCTSISNGRFGHPSQQRAISLREAAALQSFSDNYEFFGSFPSMARQIGNAVPVQLSKVFGEYFLNLPIKF